MSATVRSTSAGTARSTITSGRSGRCAIAARTRSARRTGSSALVAVTTRSAQASACSSSSSAYAEPPNRSAASGRMLGGAIGDGDVRDAAARDGLERLQTDPARAHDQRTPRAEIAEHAVGERQRHRAGGRRVRADGRLRARTPAGRDRRPEEQRERRSGRVAGGLVRVAHLAEDLGLAEHERVEPGGDAREVPRDVLARVHVEVIDELLALDPVRVGERVQERVARVLDAVHEEGVQLDPVAGREHRVLQHLGAALGAEPERPETLAQLHRSRAMAEAEADEALHEDLRVYSARRTRWSRRQTRVPPPFRRQALRLPSLESGVHNVRGDKGGSDEEQVLTHRSIRSGRWCSRCRATSSAKESSALRRGVQRQAGTDCGKVGKRPVLVPERIGPKIKPTQVRSPYGGDVLALRVLDDVLTLRRAGSEGAHPGSFVVKWCGTRESSRGRRRQVPGDRRRRDVHGRRPRRERQRADGEGADRAAPGVVGARRSGGGRPRGRSAASPTGRRSRRTRSSSAAARGRRS